MSNQKPGPNTYGSFLYTLSREKDFLHTYFNVSQAAIEQLKLYHDRVQDNPAATIEGLTRLIETYPVVPQFKNLLGAAYGLSGNVKKATEVNEWIIHEHPHYLFGKLNKANYYFFRNKPEKIPGVLGERLEIKALYPERDTFHISEVMAFNKVVCMYYIAVKNIPAAEACLVIMEGIDRKHPDAKYARQKLYGDLN